jgi:hypothetical protein
MGSDRYLTLGSRCLVNPFARDSVIVVHKLAAGGYGAVVAHRDPPANVELASAPNENVRTDHNGRTPAIDPVKLEIEVIFQDAVGTDP